MTSLDNSRRLYELSGWQDAQLGQYLTRGTSIDYFDATRVSDYATSKNLFVCPAYTAGYLLRKLRIELNIRPDTVQDSWVLITAEDVPEIRADTPEDALCLLAIKLFEQKILVKEKQ